MPHRQFLDTDGSAFTNLHSFTPSDLIPYDGFTLSGGALYGISFNHAGVFVFASNTDGSGFRLVYQFNASDSGSGPRLLISSKDFLYGISDPGGFNPTDSDPILGGVWKIACTAISV